jgi:hypothetical protein
MTYPLLLFALLAIRLNFHTSFRVSNVKLSGKADSLTHRSCMTMSSVQPMKRALLDSSTLWRISLTLTKNGFKSIEAIARVRFIEDRNYEPPQGRLFVEDDFNGLIKVDEKGYAGSWTLSEDKDDRKDGLWIWGLFQEPKYPFLYFSLGKLQNKKSIRLFSPTLCTNVRFLHLNPIAKEFSNRYCYQVAKKSQYLVVKVSQTIGSIFAWTM